MVIGSAKTTATGEFTVPLTYGAWTQNTANFRIGAIVNGQYMPGFDWLVNTYPAISVTLMATASRMPVGFAGEAAGRISRAQAGASPILQVWVGRWVTASMSVMSTPTTWRHPVSYGQNRRGAFTFRLGIYYFGLEAYSRPWTLTRY